MPCPKNYVPYRATNYYWSFRILRSATAQIFFWTPLIAIQTTRETPFLPPEVNKKRIFAWQSELNCNFALTKWCVNAHLRF